MVVGNLLIQHLLESLRGERSWSLEAVDEREEEDEIEKTKLKTPVCSNSHPHADLQTEQWQRTRADRALRRSGVAS